MIACGKRWVGFGRGADRLIERVAFQDLGGVAPKFGSEKVSRYTGVAATVAGVALHCATKPSVPSDISRTNAEHSCELVGVNFSGCCFFGWFLGGGFKFCSFQSKVASLRYFSCGDFICDPTDTDRDET